MAKHPLWNDEYWLLLIQLYLKKPAGVKALYSRQLVDLSLELHIPPQFLYEQMMRLRSIDTPRMEKLWHTYGNNPKKLSRGVKLLRQKRGYGQGDQFYEGVELNETFERDFKPVMPDSDITPIMLILILDLYFHLTPLTMVNDTPEIAELAKLIRIKPDKIVEIMEIYQIYDPYLKRQEFIINSLVGPCQQVWERFADKSPQKLTSLAAQLKDYF